MCIDLLGKSMKNTNNMDSHNQCIFIKGSFLHQSIKESISIVKWSVQGQTWIMHSPVSIRKAEHGEICALALAWGASKWDAMKIH